MQNYEIKRRDLNKLVAFLMICETITKLYEAEQ